MTPTEREKYASVLVASMDRETTLLRQLRQPDAGTWEGVTGRLHKLYVHGTGHVSQIASTIDPSFDHQ